MTKEEFNIAFNDKLDGWAQGDTVDFRKHITYDIKNDRVTIYDHHYCTLLPSEIEDMTETMLYYITYLTYRAAGMFYNYAREDEVED